MYRFCCYWPLTLYICVRDWWWNPPRWKVSSRAHRPLLDEQMRWNWKGKRRRRRWAMRKEKRAQLMSSHTRTHVIPNGGGDPWKGHPSVCWYTKSVEENYRSNDIHTNAGQIYIKERKKGTSSYPGNAGHRIEKDIIDQRIRRFRNRRRPARGERLCNILGCSHVAQQIELGDVRWLLLITLRAGFCFVLFCFFLK